VASQHTVQPFASRFSSAETLKTAAASMDDESLLWAYIWPGHLPAAKIVLLEELIRRGYTQERVSNWLPGSAQLKVPGSFQSGTSWGQYIATANRRATFFKYYRTAVVPLFMVVLFILMLQPDDENVKTLGGFFVLLFFCVVFACGALFKTVALRALLLRPFGQGKMTQVLRRLVPKSIGKIGHIYTLSDRNYRPNLFLELMGFVSGFVVALLSPFFLNSIRVGKVHSARSFHRLELFMIKQLRLSLLSFQNGGQAFNVRCSDAWWKICVLMLMHSCEVIVIDLSMVKQGTAWELNALRDTGILSKCLFIVGENQLAMAQGKVEEHFGDTSKIPIYTYNSDGEFSKDSQFQTALKGIAFST
jgi:hypothetical protein